MTIADQIAADQRAALETIRRVAESLPGFTFQETSATMGAELPDTVNIEQPLTSPLLVPGGNASA